jgi:thioesterase domain-containing protein
VTGAKLDLAVFMASVSSRMIVPLNAEAALLESKAPAFYCVHAITGAGVTDFAALAKAIGDGVRVFAIHAPKKLMLTSDYDALLTSIAGQYAEAITKSQPEGPINLGGFSSGAMVALETSRKLRALGREVHLLVSLDGAPKNIQVANSRWGYLAKWAWNLPAALVKEDMGRLWRQLLFKTFKYWTRQRTAATDDDATHPVRETVNNYSSYPAHQRRFMRTLYDAIEKTSFDRYEGAVVVYKATIKPIFLSGVAEFWRRVAPHCEIVNIPGTHASMVLDPDVRPIAADLARRLKATPINAQERSQAPEPATA